MMGIDLVLGSVLEGSNLTGDIGLVCTVGTASCGLKPVAGGRLGVFCTGGFWEEGGLALLVGSGLDLVDWSGFSANLLLDGKVCVFGLGCSAGFGWRTCPGLETFLQASGSKETWGRGEKGRSGFCGGMKNFLIGYKDRRSVSMHIESSETPTRRVSRQRKVRIKSIRGTKRQHGTRRWERWR